MSRIWDALRQAERDKNLTVHGTEAQTRHGLMPAGHSNECLSANVIVLVYGYGAADDPFHELTEAFSVNTRGGVLILTTVVNLGQTLLLTNEINLKRETCVVREVSTQSDGTRVVFEFLQPIPDFWDGI